MSSEQIFSVADIRAGLTTTGSLGSSASQPQNQPEGRYQPLLYPLFVAAADGSQCYWPRLRGGDEPAPAQVVPQAPRKVILRLPPSPGATSTDDATTIESESGELAIAAPPFLPRVVLRLNPPSEEHMPSHANAETDAPPAPHRVLPRITIRIPRRFTNDASPVGASGASSPSPPPRAEPGPSISSVPPKENAKGKQSKSKKRKAVEIEDDATDPVDAVAKPADASPKKRQRKTTRAAKPKQKL